MEMERRMEGMVLIFEVRGGGIERRRRRHDGVVCVCVWWRWDGSD